MSIRFSLDTDFASPPERVFAALTTLDDAGQWMPGFIGLEKLDDRPFGVGTEWRETRKIMGRESTEQLQVTEHDPPRRFAIRIDGTKGTSGKGEYLFAYDLAPAGGGTRVRLDAEIRGGGWLMALMGRLFAGSMKKMIAADMEAMRRHVDAKDAAAVG